MSNSEEKIKAFFSDEEKVKALVNDKEFIEKVSDGTATTETYQKAFKKFGIELNIEEAKEIQKTTQTILEKSITKLGDSTLSDVSGGKVYAALGVAGVPFLAGSGCAIAACVYYAKANNAKAKKDSSTYNKYIAKAKSCGVAAGTLGGISILGGSFIATT